MKLFLGEYDHNLDERGRVTLPKKLRVELEEESIILSRGFDNCIFGFDKREWELQAARQLDTSIIDSEGRRVRRYLFAGAEKVEIDKLGRIILPALLKEYSGITNDVVIVGAGDHFEIWDKQKWEAYSLTLGTK